MKLKWGILGAGGIADQCTIAGLLDTSNSEVVAVMDRKSEVANRVKEKYNIPRSYKTVEDLLGDEEVDVVYIATPVFCHLKDVLAAAEAKKHIFLEKPMGMDPYECQTMIDAAEKNGVKLGIAFMMRYGAYHQAVKEILADGRIGQIVNVRMQYSWWYPDADVWRLDPKLSGGGCTVDLGSHCIDLIQYLIGSRIKSVSGVVSTKTFHYQVEDSAQAIFLMEDGTWGSLNFYFNIPNSISNNTLEIYGTKGSLVCYDTIGREDVGRVVLKLAGENGRTDFSDYTEQELKVMPVNRYTKETEDFTKSILCGEKPPISAEDGQYVLKITDAIYRSTKTRRFVDIL